MRGGEMEMTPPFCFLFTPNINYPKIRNYHPIHD